MKYNNKQANKNWFILEDSILKWKDLLVSIDANVTPGTNFSIKINTGIEVAKDVLDNMTKIAKNHN